MRRWLVGASALVLVLGACDRVSAASTVTMYFLPNLPGNTFDVYVDNSLSVPLGAAEAVVVGATAFSLNTALRASRRRTPSTA